MFNTNSADHVVYIDHSSSAINFGYATDSARPDSLISIIRDSSFILASPSLPASNTNLAILENRKNIVTGKPPIENQD
jgi:hypothetical protein